MNTADWIALAGAVGAVAAVVVAALAYIYGRKDARESANAARKSQEETERQVKISQRIADVADQTFGSSCLPIIVSDAIPDPPFEYLQKATDERNSWHRGDFTAVYIQYPIRNVGVGPAMIASVKMTIIIALDETSETYDARSSIAAMAPSEIGLMTLLSPHNGRLFDSLERGQTLTAEISYTDIGAKRRYLTRFVLKPREHVALKAFGADQTGTTRDFRLDTAQIYECDERGNIKGPPIASNKQPDPVSPPQD